MLRIVGWKGKNYMIEIKEAKLNDFDFYYDLKCEESSVYWGGFSQIPQRNKLYEFWESVTEKSAATGRTIYIMYVNKLPVGYAQVIEENGRLVLSIGISENSRGNGYGNSIIKNVINLRGGKYTYYCYIREDNFASIKSFEKNGFKKTGFSHKQRFELDNIEYKMNEYVREPSKIIAIIPARSGSKGLRDKNIRLLNGKPLLAYSVEAAIDSELFDTVHVSTDSPRYLDIAKAYGADEPFLREKQNALDVSSSWDVVREVLQKYLELGKKFDICFLLQPTSPMRKAEDIKKAYRTFLENDAVCLSSVTEVNHPIQWCFRLDEACSMKEFAFSPYKNCRRQELETYYRENGAIYIVRTRDINNPSFEFYSNQCVAFIMDHERSIDIDTLYDFVAAEAIIKLESEEIL